MPDEFVPERALVAAIVGRGDEDAFRALYRLHAGPLRACVRRWLGPSTDRTDDVLQETWLRAVRQLPQFSWRSSLRTWLIGIAINCCREVTRPQLHLIHGQLDDQPASDPRPDERIDLETALARLPAGYRRILLLHDVYGLTHDEIGDVLQIETGTSKSQLSRARASLRRLLGSAYSAPNEQDSANV